MDILISFVSLLAMLFVIYYFSPARQCLRGKHDYADATRNDSGYWQTTCKTCGGSVQLKNKKWEDV